MDSATFLAFPQSHDGIAGTAAQDGNVASDRGAGLHPQNSFKQEQMDPQQWSPFGSTIYGKPQEKEEDNEPAPEDPCNISKTTFGSEGVSTIVGAAGLGTGSTQDLCNKDEELLVNTGTFNYDDDLRLPPAKSEQTIVNTGYLPTPENADDEKTVVVHHATLAPPAAAVAAVVPAPVPAPAALGEDVTMKQTLAGVNDDSLSEIDPEEIGETLMAEKDQLPADEQMRAEVVANSLLYGFNESFKTKKAGAKPKHDDMVIRGIALMFIKAGKLTAVDVAKRVTKIYAAAGHEKRKLLKKTLRQRCTQITKSRGTKYTFTDINELAKAAARCRSI